jgi:hypothetical protein
VFLLNRFVPLLVPLWHWGRFVPLLELLVGMQSQLKLHNYIPNVCILLLPVYDPVDRCIGPVDPLTLSARSKDDTGNSCHY